MAKYLVTGGAGFIGSHIVEELLKQGEEVVILDNFSSGIKTNLETFNGYELIDGDICDYKTCLKACLSVNFVLHHAALRSVPESIKNPYKYNEVNINGTLNMLKASAECNVKRLVFASSSSVYGETNKFPQEEVDLPNPISPYALTKLAGENYCNIFNKYFGLETVCLRYFNVFGPRQSVNDEYSIVIPKFISCFMRNKNPPIFGNGKQSRDFIFVKDIVNANLLATTTSGINGMVFNISYGEDNSIDYIVKLLNLITEKHIQPEFLKERSGDVYKTLGNIFLANDVLKFNPEYTFEKGLKLTFDWFNR